MKRLMSSERFHVDKNGFCFGAILLYTAKRLTFIISEIDCICQSV